MFELDSSTGTTDRELRAPESESAPEECLSSANVSPAPGASPVMHGRVIRGWFWRSLAVIAEVAVAFLLREAIAHRHPGFAPFITFYPVLLLAALLDGLWAGIAVTVLSTLVADLWCFAPTRSLFIKDPYNMSSLRTFFSSWS